MKNLLSNCLALTVAALLASCSKTNPVPRDVLAKMGSFTITTADLEQEINRQGQSVNDPAIRSAVLQELIAREALYQSAIRAGVDKDPQVLDSWKNLLIGHWKERQLEPGLQALAVTSAEAKAYYLQHPDKYRQSPQRRLAMLHLKTRPNMTQANRELRRARLAEAREKALQLDPETVGFGSLAVDHSEDQATRYRGGDLGWLKTDASIYSWNSKALAAGFALPRPGAVSDIIETEDGYYLLKLVEQKESALTPFEQVEAGIRHRLLTQKRQKFEMAFVQKARAGTDIQVFPDHDIPSPDSILAQLKSDPSSPPALP